jgi:hypothetical protein
MMRWFDRDYATGGLSDDEWSVRQADFAVHLETIRPHLADGAEQLLSSVHLHDGQVAAWTYEPGRSFVIRVLAGDLQRGYEWITLTYGDATLVDTDESDLRRWWSADAIPNEIIQEEVDCVGDDGYEHRMLLWPDGDVCLRFRALTIGRMPAHPSDRR